MKVMLPLDFFQVGKLIKKKPSNIRIEKIAKKKNIDIQTVVNQLLKSDIDIAEFMQYTALQRTMALRCTGKSRHVLYL
jgi:hypothetical protein